MSRAKIQSSIIEQEGAAVDEIERSPHFEMITFSMQIILTRYLRSNRDMRLLKGVPAYMAVECLKALGVLAPAVEGLRVKDRQNKHQ